MRSSNRRRRAETGSVALIPTPHRHTRSGAKFVMLETLEARAYLTGTAASPFDAPVFTPLPNTPQIVVGGFAALTGQSQQVQNDLDGNGKADLIVRYDTGAEPKTEFLSALLGQTNGSMTEQPITNYTGGNEIVNVISADLNNDTRLDLVVHWEHPGTGEPQFIDTDGDSIPDTLSSGDEHHLDIFLGNADGSFTKTATTLDINENASVSVFKMNADANVDIVLDLELTTLDVLLGNGNGSFQAPIRTDFGADKLINEFQTDLNGDNITDVILNYSNFFSPKAVEVFLGQSNGSYQSTPSFSDTTTGYTVIGLHKFSGDSRPDLLVSIAPTDPFNPFPPATNVAVLLNNGSGNFSETFNKTLTNGLRGFGSFGVAAGDLNGDGVDDLVIFDGSSTATLNPVIVRVEINGGSATFTEPQSFSVDRFSNAQVQDIDNDNRPDLIVNRRDQDTTPAGASVFFNGGTGTFITPDVFVTATSEVLITPLASFQDMGNDHRAEALLHKVSGGYTAPVTENKFFGFKQNANHTFGAEHLTDFGANTQPDFALLDYTGDHNADALVYQNFTAGTLTNFYGTADSLKVYRGTGDGGLTAPPGVLAFGGSVQALSYPTDYEGDGDFDLFSVGANPSGIYVVKNTGNSSGGGDPTDNAGNSTTLARDITVGALQSFPDFVGAADTQDFYRFTVSPGSQVHIDLTGLTSNADLQLLDSGGSLITGSTQPGSTDESITHNLTPGTYFIRVFQNSGDTNYALAVSSVPLAVVMGVQLGNTFITSGQTSIDFGTVSQGGAATTLTFTVQNNGNDTLTLQTPSLPAGYSAGSDDLVPSLAPNEIDTFTVQLDATLEGVKNGNITIGNNSPTNPFRIPVTGSVVNVPLPHIAVTGNSVAITDGDILPDTNDGTDFGSVVQGTTPLIRTFIVTNSGTAPLTLDLSPLPTGFTVVDSLVPSLEPSASDIFSIQLNTDTLGPFPGQVSIVTNDTAHDPFTFAVSGIVTTEPLPIIAVLVGVVPVTSGQPDAINFGDVSQGTPPPSRTFTVRNNGTAPLTLQTPLLPAGFIAGADTLDASLLPNGFDTFTVLLDTAAVGAAAGNITFTHNSGGTQATFSIPVSATVSQSNGGGGGLPDLTGEIQQVSLGKNPITPQDKLLPGDTLNATLRVFNAGIGVLNAGNIDITFFASTDFTIDGDDIELQSFTAKNPVIAGGDHVDLNFNVLLPQNTPPGNYRLLARLDANSQIPESGEANNTAPSGTILPVVLEVGQVGSRSNVTLTLQEPDGTLVTFGLSGGGTAGISIDPETGAIDLNILEVGAKSTLTINSKPATKGGDNTVLLRNVAIAASASTQPVNASALSEGEASTEPRTASQTSSSNPLGKLLAKTARLIGTLTAPGGLGALTLDAAEGAIIDIGAPADPKATLTLSLNLLKDVTFTSQTPVKALSVVQWLDTDETPDSFTAPSLGSLATKGNKAFQIAGDFEADLNLTGVAGQAITLGSAKIAGALASAAWSITGNAGAITVAGNTNSSSITAGTIKALTLNGGVNTLAVNLTQPYNPANTKLVNLPKLAVKGVADQFTLISTGNVGAVTFGGLINSAIYVGLAGETPSFPSAADDFLSNPGPSLGKVAIIGTYTASNIAAPTIASLALPEPTTANGGIPFGVASRAIQAGKIGTLKLVDADKSGSIDPLTIGDFELRIV